MNRKAGFTITELMFAMAFVAALLIILLTSIIQITHTYNKGLTLKRVNQSGRTLGAELQRVFQGSDPNSINDLSQDQGRLCLGGYSFAWSIPGEIENNYDNPENSPVGFARVRDPGATVCSDPNSEIPVGEGTVELIGDGLVMRNLTQYTYITGQGNRALVGMQYTISTPSIGGGGLIRCEGGQSDDFCALNTFNVTVYAKGR